MNCNEAIEYIHSLEKFGINPGMERINALCNELGNPQRKLKFFHIAGTNGKGSTSTMISNILIKNGYNTGLFISPYVVDFRERIQYNGEMISHDELAECVGIVRNAINKLSAAGIQPTEFEAVTATAFLYFKKKKCDYVVLEVGLGGRLDSTNIIDTPCMSVITSISLDHTAILGDTVEEISSEKAGIIKENGKTVLYPFQENSAYDVIRKTCKEKNNLLFVPDIDKLSVIDEKITGTEIRYKDYKFNLKLAGKHMVYNACTAIEAVISSEVDVSYEKIISGLESTVMPARTELINNNPLILLDGGHNEGCAKALSAYIRKHLNDKKIIMISSMMADKDCLSYLSEVAVYADNFIATKADVPRALSSDELMNIASEFCKNCCSVPNPFDAVEKAKELLSENSVILVCGSFYLAGEIRNELLKI